MSEVAARLGYWTQHDVNTGGGRSDDPDPRWMATCETCEWRGAKNQRTEAGWEATAAEVRAHRESSRVFVPVEHEEIDGVVFVVEDQNYDSAGLVDVYSSLAGAFVAHPHPWLQRGDDYWVREDGDAIAQTAMSIVRVEVQRWDASALLGETQNTKDEPR